MTEQQRVDAAIALEEQHAAHNYHPLEVVVSHGDGAWVTDIAGRRYLDCLAAYSAVNFGHGNPVLVAAAKAQLDRITLTSRAFHNDQLGPFVAALAALAGKEMVLPMNTGAEAVESAIKVARAWGYRVKGVPPDRAKIIVADGNFHGRTTTIVSFSSDPDARNDFGPFTPGFVSVPVRRCRGARGGDRREHRRRAARADPGRGGHHRSPGRLSSRRSRDHRAAQRAVHRRRDPVGSRTHRRDVPVRQRGRRPRPVPARQGARRRHRARERRRRRRGCARRAAARASTARPSVGIRSRPRSDSRSSGCCRPANTRSAPACSATACTPAFAGWSAAGLSRSAGPACGPASTSIRRWHRASRLRAAARARRPREGHPRQHHPSRAAARGRAEDLDWAVDQLEPCSSTRG